jgi:hypothetical protein
MGFAHGDLHSGNIMREVVGEGGPLPEVRYIVIDFSEAHQLEETQEGLLKDLESLGEHLRGFSDAVYRRDNLPRGDEKVLKAIEHLPGLLKGITAETVAVWKPIDVLNTFQESLRSAEEAPRKLRTPFDSLSAENITNDELLAKLCFTSNWWSTELEKPGNVLLVGPRGCGKSMMFRRHRLKTKIAAKRAKELSSDGYIGFYLPCESVFFNRISDLSETIVRRYGDALILFFNMAVTSEVASTLAVLPEFLGPVTTGTAEALNLAVQEEIQDLQGCLQFPNGVIHVSDLADRAERVMRWVRRAIAYGEHVPARGSLDYLARLVDTVKHQLPSLSGRLFVFFLDDYTAERVPLALQKILHPIVCQRSGELCFKISAHMFGSMYSSPQPLALDEGRNINVINLGSEYLNPKKKKAERDALVRIMNVRFKESQEYKGTIEAWLGRSTFPKGMSLNRALHNEESREEVEYNGIDCLQQLCTGDISEMIRMVRDIFREAGVRGGPPKRQIPPGTQDKAIRNVSREFLARVRHIRPDGQKLFEVLYAFGDLSKQLLYERNPVSQGKNHRGHPRTDPYDLLTIYVDDLTRASRAMRHVWERLQQASIFVDIRLAPSQRAVIADRVTLRRIYCPAFATTLTSSEHLQLTKKQFEWFIDKPDEFCKDHLRRLTGAGEGPTLWTKAELSAPEEALAAESVPLPADRTDFTADAPSGFKEVMTNLPALTILDTALKPGSEFDLFIGAMGFEERTDRAAEALVRQEVKVKRALMLEFDLYYEATEDRRPGYESLLWKLAAGRPYRPVNSPVGIRDPLFGERFKAALKSATGPEKPRILFDCTSCPSLVLSRCLGVLLEFPCELTLLYSEADEYYPTRKQWEAGEVTRMGGPVAGPFSGVRYIEKPPLLQADDTGERPILLVLFPTFITERTSGVLAEVEPAKRIWLFGEPHNLEKNSFRVPMAQYFAAPSIVPGDPWSLVGTFDYRPTMAALAGIYGRHRSDYRLVVMPHGSKMQTVGVNLFASAHELSMVFAVPKDYNPKCYSEGCVQVWAVALGDTSALMRMLKSNRVTAL